MATFSNAEYADIVFMYGRADGNGSLARRMYQERYPNRRVPHVRVFYNTFRRLSESGIHRAEPGVNPGRHSTSTEEDILAAFEADPGTSVRVIARNLNISQWKVWKTLNSNNRYPFHGTGVQGLEEQDPHRRIELCRWLLNGDIENAWFLKSILWTDESKFSREGITNFHNLHQWANKDNNPHWKKQVTFQRKFSVNVWAGVIGRTLIGPHFLPDNLNGDNYLEFLQNDFPALAEESGAPIFDTDREIIFQQDGCPAHWTLNVREHLHNSFPQSWIGRGGPIPWPARSPDLTPMDFFVWGRAKELVYTSVEINTKEELIQRINSAFATMKLEMMLKTTTTEIRKRARACVRNRGGHFEHQ